jgi:hypothetical protein
LSPKKLKIDTVKKTLRYRKVLRLKFDYHKDEKALKK